MLPEGEEIAAISRIPKASQRQSEKALLWLLIMQKEYHEKLGAPDFTIRHVYNAPAGREHYLGFPRADEHRSYCALDGYTKHDGKEYFFQFHGCYWHGCQQCFGYKWQERHPHRRIPSKEVYRNTEALRNDIRFFYGHAEYIVAWEHEFDHNMRQLEHAGWFDDVSPWNLIDTDMMTDRDVFFGGRVEVFDHLSVADLEKGEEIKCIDVVFHYPNICAFHKLCTGHPGRLLGPEINLQQLDPANPNRYFGYFRGWIIPCPNDKYGGMPKKSEHGQLVFSNEPDMYCGFLEELYDRIEHGARIGRMHEVLHFDDQNARVGPFYGHMAYSFRDKMEASGWADLTRDTPFDGVELTDEIKLQLQE